ncbi:pentapeptide repeat-containing protein [Verrucomicrobiales bacterium]|nr:pentapeptide repeat-containing protein [Verrucomicrobiales bacterium]
MRAMILWALGTALGMSQGELSVRSEGDRILMDWRSPSLTADSNAVLSPPGRLEFSDDLIQWEATGETAPQRLSGKAQSHRFTITSTSAVRFYRVVVEKFDLANANLSGRDLTGLDLSDMDLTGAKFDGATLDKANLTRSILTNASFVNVQAASANFGGVVGESVTFRQSVLSGSRFKHARLPGADFSGATLNKINFGDAHLPEANFAGSDLRRAYLDEDAVADEADFTSALLERAILAQSSFKEARFGNADLTLADMRLADFQMADFEGADLTAANTGWADFTEATGLVEVNNAIYFVGNVVSVTGRAHGGSIQWALGF